MSAVVPSATADHSRYVQRVRRTQGERLHLLAPGAPVRATIETCIDAFLGQGRTLASALRLTRHLVMERLAVLDVEAQADLSVVTRGVTELAEVVLDRSVCAARADLDARYGPLQTEDGQPIDFWVVGMGKLGARELNVSSDIDLIYVYETDGRTIGAPGRVSTPLSAQEYFTQVARQLQNFIADVTEDGIVFRMDLALRPNGNSGLLAVSLSMLEDYLQIQGREWERFAWLKGRVVAPRASVESGRTNALRDVCTPFVFRRFLDYGVFESLRQLHQKIRTEAQRRASGRPDRANDVKLSRGGIREIEFIVQLLQVVRGGHYPELRTRPTLKALETLAAVGLLPVETSRKLAEAYVFLRKVEHRIQYLDDQQTHTLPSADHDLQWIARSMGLPCTEDACVFLEELGRHREFVAMEFDALLHDGQQPSSNGNGGCKGCGSAALTLDSPALREGLSPAANQRLTELVDHPRVMALREESRQRLAKLLMRARKGCEEWMDDQAPLGDVAWLRFIDWLQPLLRRESYLALLTERSAVLTRLLRLLALARWPMRYLMQHPGVVDELADARLSGERFDAQSYLADLRERHDAWERGGEANEEALLETLRRAHQAETFRILVRDVEGDLTVEQVADELSALADATLTCALQWAWAHLRHRHREMPRFAVIAYGKLGGKELGYGSDLDLVFVFDDDDDRSAEVYSAYARKIITWLSLRTASGMLYEIDTALRPNGNSGLLVTSMTSFENYQQGRGSNAAWTWEHQAITRARWCAGDPELKPRFDEVRRAVMCAPRDLAALRKEITGMREKVQQAHPVRPGRYDVKQSRGAMFDVEFVVQYLVLAHSAEHACLLDNVGNIALLLRAEEVGLLPAGVGTAAAGAYRTLRQVQHRARLDEASTQFALDEHPELVPLRTAVLALWRHVFEGPTAQ